MSDWRDELVGLHHCHDLQREAEQERLAHLALEGRQENHTVFCCVMSWLGSRLSTLGNSLQVRYGKHALPLLMLAETKKQG